MASVLVYLFLIGCGNVQFKPSIAEDAGVDVGAGADAPPDDGRARLAVTVTGGAPGSVTSPSSGIDCGADCTERLPVDTLVTLEAVSAVGASFAGWTGPCSGSAPTCTFTLHEDTEVGARFEIAMHTVTLEIAGNGPGSIVGSAGGLACPGSCSATLPYGATLMLTAVPQGAGSQFVGWSGGPCTGTAPCTIAVTEDVEVTAAFGLNYTLVVTQPGNGNGSVTSSPAGIACGLDCSEVYAMGTSVALTATPSANSIFAGWSGGCTGSGGCTLPINSAVGVSATFTLRQYMLSVISAGNGGGVVTSTPGGITCPSQCSQAFNHGQMVTLGATPNVQSVFTGWSGACSGTGTCTVAMDQVRSVTATFTLKQFALTVNKSGGGTGTVTHAPGIDCGSDCSELYNIGTVVTLTPTADSGSVFAGWAGGCTGGGGCTVTMSAAITVTAMFERTFTFDGEWGAGGTDTVAMGTTNNRVCFVSAVTGQFGIGGGDVRVFMQAGQWVLSVTGLVIGYAQCMSYPAASGISTDGEYKWSQGEPALNLGSDTRRLCLLTRMAGKYNGGGELIRTSTSGGNWFLSGTSGGNLGVTAEARCVSWPASTPLTYTGEELWTAPAGPTNLGSTSNRMCAFSLITGAYIGTGELAYVRPSGASWSLGGMSQQPGVASRARCLVAQ